MTFNFIKFEATKLRADDRIKIIRNYMFTFPKVFCVKNEIQGKKYAVLYYDGSNNAVGIEITDRDQKGVFTLGHDKRRGSAYLTAISFFKAHKIDPAKYKGKYEWEKIKTNEKDMFVIKLNDDKKDKNV